MLKAAKVAGLIIFVFLLLPALLFVAIISVQEGCLLCFQGDGAGGPWETGLNVALVGAIGLGLWIWFRKPK